MSNACTACCLGGKTNFKTSLRSKQWGLLFTINMNIFGRSCQIKCRTLWRGADKVAPKGVRFPERPTRSETPADFFFLFWKSERKAYKVLAKCFYSFGKSWFLQHRFSRNHNCSRELRGYGL